MAYKQPAPGWDKIALWFPEFVAWVVQKYGPLPTGPADEAQYNAWKKEYEQNVGYTGA